MKYIIPALLMAFCANAQSIAEDTTDNDTGTRTVITKNFAAKEIGPDDTIARDGLVFFSAGVQQTKKANTTVEIYFVELNIVHSDSRLGCLTQGVSKIILELEDGSKMECTQISDTDCDPLGFKSAFALMPKGGTSLQMKQNFEKLKNVQIRKIDVITTEREVIYAVKSKSRQFIQGHFALLEKTFAK